jgi:hypothetical protein
MSAGVRIASFFAVLALVFAAAVGIGGAVGPTNRSEHGEDANHEGDSSMTMRPAGHTAAAPQGLSIASEGFRLVAQTSGFTAGRTKRLRFRIVDRDGATVRDFDVEHAKRLHLIVVRRDLTRYAHVHPAQQADGSWTVPLRFADPGAYRVFADFTARGADRVTLGTDVIVPGSSQAAPLPAPAQRVVVDGYDVAIANERRARDEQRLAFTVSRDGRPVVVEPYLGADGHLVTLRAGDLAYLHAHSVERSGGAGPITFVVDYPSAGRYRLFLQFRHETKVHTAEFTQELK